MGEPIGRHSAALRPATMLRASSLTRGRAEGLSARPCMAPAFSFPRTVARRGRTQVEAWAVARCRASLPPVGSPDTLFAGTGDAGLFVSRDGGRSWSRTGRQTLGDRIMAVDATRDGRTVYAGTQESGLFVSRDGGGTWNAIVLPFGPQLMVTAIDIDPADELHVAVTVTGGGTGLSKNGGRAWFTSRKGSLPSDCAAVQFLPGGASGLSVGTQSGALYFSADGLDWQLTFQLPDGGHVFGLERSGTGVLAATSHGVFSSGDGTAWSDSSTGITNLTLAGLAASPVDANVLYAATDQGVFRSPDAGISWSCCSESKRTLSVLVLQDGRTVLAGTADGSVLRSVDGGDHWIAVSRGIPGVRVSILASRSAGPTMVYAGTDGGFAVSNDAGLTWEPRNIGLVATTSPGYRVVSPTPRIEIAALLPDTATPGTVILSLLGQGLYITRDDGNRWKRLQSSMGTPWVDSLAVDEQTGRLLRRHGHKGCVCLAGRRDDVVPFQQRAVDHPLRLGSGQHDRGRSGRHPVRRNAGTRSGDVTGRGSHVAASEQRSARPRCTAYHCGRERCVCYDGALRRSPPDSVVRQNPALETEAVGDVVRPR